MVDVEQISRKLRSLDAERLQTLAEFLDFLLTRRDTDSGDAAFPASTFQAPDSPSVYHGQPLTLEQMSAAVDWEAGRSQ